MFFKTEIYGQRANSQPLAMVDYWELSQLLKFLNVDWTKNLEVHGVIVANFELSEVSAY